ncbi:MAG: DUF4091 domain-containing protein, partial [Planctomycetota bacterium]
LTPTLLGGDSHFSKKDFSFYKSMAIQVKQPSDSNGKVGTYFDPLIPLKGPLVINPGSNQLLWVTLRTRNKTPSKLYSFQIYFPEEKITIPLEIQVLPFSLPDAPSLKAYYLVDTPDMIQKYHKSQDLEKMIQKYAQLLLSYRMHPGNFDYPQSLHLRVRNNKVQMDFNKIDDWLKKSLKTTSVFPLPFPLESLSKYAPYKSKKFEALVIQTLRQLYQHYQEKGWISKHFVYIDEVKGYTPKHISDEPYNIGKAGYDEVRYWGRLIHKAKNKLKFMVATPPYTMKGWGKIEDAVDIYNYYVAEVDEYTQKTHELAKNGKEIFLVPNSFSDNLDYPGLFHRGLGFFCAKHHLAGIEQWDVFGWYHYEGDPEPNPKEGILPQKWGVGAGVLVYPGGPFGVDGPISSIRLEQNRDGIEDFEYFKILEKLVPTKGKEYISQIASRLIPLDYASMKPDPNLFYKVRNFLIQEILRFQKGGALLPVMEGRITDSHGHPVAGAAVVGEYFATTTDLQGRYSLFVGKKNQNIKVFHLLYKEAQGKAGMKMQLKPRESKVISSFENRDDHYEAGFEDSNEKERKVRGGEKISSKYVTHGKKSLRLRVPKGYSVGIEPYDFPSDWRKYKYLALDVYNPEEYPIVVNLALSDGKEKYREVDQDVITPGKKQSCLPKQWTTLIFPLEELKVGGIIGFYFRPALDLGHIKWLSIIIENEHNSGPIQCYVDHL